MKPQDAVDAFNAQIPVIHKRARDEIEYEAISALIQRKCEGRTELFVELADYNKNSVTVVPVANVYIKE